MSIPHSILAELLKALPALRPQTYFKSSLTALSHAMEDRMLADFEQPLVIASFQRERFYRQEAHRYRRIARKSSQVYVLSAPETDFKNSSDLYETIAFEPTDSLAQEWHLVVIGQQFASCLICRERHTSLEKADVATDNSRRFEGIWTFDRQVSQQAAAILLKKIEAYRPELAAKVALARRNYIRSESEPVRQNVADPASNSDPFVQRLITYLQVSQYKLIKANQSLTAKQQKEQLLNSVTTAIRRSLDPEEILRIGVQKLGEGLEVCRCIVYRCREDSETAQINHEFLCSGIPSLQGQTWPLQENSLFRQVAQTKESLSIADTADDPRLQEQTQGFDRELQALVQRYSIVSWLLVPLLYQDKLLGMLELHKCNSTPTNWKEDVALIEAIATQVGVALIQAEAYANLENLNQQLEALDRTRSNLVAITGHELRTPLSTIQVCLESLASEPDMSPELRQVMLNTALDDAERMRKLVQDFLTLSQLESGRVQWHLELLSLQECLDLALSNVRARNLKEKLPQIEVSMLCDPPLVRADGEWLVELLAKLLDNACKFTEANGQVSVNVSRHSPQSLEVTVSDTGRGIEPKRLESVFDRFYQEEGALRRSTGGTGLGLAICRQIVNGWGGEIWAESDGKNRGSQFHFTVPMVASVNAADSNNNGRSKSASRRRRQSRTQKKNSKS